MTFPLQVNSDLLYRSPDGRECFVIFDGHGLAHIGVDITSPETLRTVGLTAEALRTIADRLDATAT